MSLPGRQIEVSSWIDLVSELHSKKIVPFRPDEGNHIRAPYAFRGMDVASWHLTTSFERLSNTATTRPALVERSLIRSFRKYASAGSFDQRSEWYVLAVAQHNGLPTRCLDWSASPLVAAHFACADERYKNDDGVIWCLNAEILRDINGRSNPQAATLQGVAWVYDTRLLEHSFADLAKLEQTSATGQLMLLWEPPSLDQRIASQSGLLSIMNSTTGSQEAFLQKHCAQYPDLLVRIVLKAKMKSETRDMLDQNNINERVLFPGLPGLCGWLKRYYGAAW
jgi:FRG domain